MLEALLVRSSNMGQLMNQTTGVDLVSGASINRLSGSLWDDGDSIFLYGGFDGSYTPMNDIYKFTPPANTAVRVGDSSGTLEFKLDATMVQNAKPQMIGRKLYCVGGTTNNLFAIKIIDLDAKTSRTVISSISSVTSAPVTDGTQYGADYDGSRYIYIKRYGNPSIIRYDVTLETYTTLATGTGRFGSAEFIICGSDALYLMGGWNNTTSTEVYRVTYNGSQITQNDTLPANGTSINQGYVTRNRKFYYLTWTGSAFLVNCYEPGTKRFNANPFNANLTYRNCCCIGNLSDGLAFGGGTSIAQGGTNWKTAGRITALYRVHIKE